MTTTDYLTQLETDRQDLVDNLETKGITGLSGDETFTELVPEVLNISSGGSGNEAHPEFVSFRGYAGNNLDISWLRTDNMTNLDSLFLDSSHLTTVDVSNFDTSNITSMQSTFGGMSNLQSIDLSNWDTSNVTSMFYMFGSCSLGLTSFNLALNLSKVTNMSQMFANCNSLRTFTFANNLSNPLLTNISSMFQGCGLLSIDLTNFNLQSVTDTSSLFSDCQSLENITFGNYSIQTTTLNGMFTNCASLQNIYNFPEIDQSVNLTYAQSTFYGCSNLTNLDLSSIKSKKMRYINHMFYNCASLETVDLSNIDTDYYSSNASYMFYNCTSMQSIDLRSYNLNRIRTYTSMFGNSSADGVPDNCLIIVKDDTSKNWVTAYFSRLTNVKTVAELEAL